MSASIEETLQRLRPFIEQEDDERSIVLMICGIAGSGKSTIAEAIVKEMPQFRRVSIDEIICSKHGLYGVDFPADIQLYQEYQGEADRIFVQTVEDSLKENQNMVLERSFWAKCTRDVFKQIIEKGGGRWVLVYLQMRDKEEVWKRICNRSAQEKNADSAFDITRETFDSFWTGFEVPQGEGEIILDT